ncbi:MAG: hypothetical protein DDG60_07955 [Anaerolineae bacterium]|nr:MAG: hypothetical protein DDG60_07955 [Anaerolineae bacterium]
MTDELDPQLKQLLDDLKPVPPRDPQRAARGRARFLAESAQPVSENAFLRLINQILQFRKERFSMNTILTLVLVFAALFGGTAGTVYAAQDALPTETLYPVKTLTEDLRLALASEPEARLTLLTDLAQTRVEEMTQLAQAGVVPPEATLTRWQEQTRQALELAASLPEADMLRTMEQLRDRLRDQLRLVEQCAATGEPLQTMTRARDQLQQHLQLLENGLADPQGFRNAAQNGFPAEQPGGYGPGNPPEATPGSGSGYGPGNPPEATPGSGSGNGPGNPPEATPGSGSGYGPGNPPTATPGSGSGNGPGNPPEATPGSGSGNGPGNPPEATPAPGGSGPNPSPVPGNGGGNRP